MIFARFKELLGKLPFLGLVVATAGVVSLAIASLGWRIEHDLAYMAYVTSAIDHWHLVPYRDLFEINMPGCFVLYMLLGHWGGYSDLGFRIADLIYLALICAATIALLRPFGAQAAWGGAVMFALAYLLLGPFSSLQREYLLILPITLTLLLLLRGQRLPLWATAGGIGLLFGCCLLVKPHAIIALPVAFVVLLLRWRREARPRAQRITAVLVMAGAFAAPILVAIGWLVHVNAWTPLVRVTTQYVPLYAVLGDRHQMIEGSRLAYAVQGYFASIQQFGLWIPPALLAAALLLVGKGVEPVRRWEARVLAAYAVCYLIYPALAAKYWTYHWFIALYFLTLFAGLCLADWFQTREHLLRLAPMVVLTVVALCIALPLIDEVPVEIDPGAQGARLSGMEKIIARLQPTLRPGDRIQPIEWNGGIAQAMLRMNVPPATPYLVDFIFHHHLSNPFVQGMKADFIAKLEHARPRYVVMKTRNPFYPSGRDTSRDFPELRHLLATEYKMTWAEHGYRIYERKLSEP